jgi:bacteriorhodopsin
VWPYIAPLVLWQGSACLSAAFSHRPFQTQSASAYSWACIALGLLQAVVLFAPMGLTQPNEAVSHMATFAFVSSLGLLGLTAWMARLR